jgi:hypothetical protein
VLYVRGLGCVEVWYRACIYVRFWGERGVGRTEQSRPGPADLRLSFENCIPSGVFFSFPLSFPSLVFPSRSFSCNQCLFLTNDQWLFELVPASIWHWIFFYMLNPRPLLATLMLMPTDIYSIGREADPSLSEPEIETEMKMKMELRFT